MPRLSDTMQEGAISTWRKQPGDTVAAGDVLVEIETDKAVMEYEAYQAGTLAEILVPEGRSADIGAPIALLDDGAGGPAPSVPAAEPERFARTRAAGSPRYHCPFRPGTPARRRLPGRERKRRRRQCQRGRPPGRVTPGAEACPGEPPGPVARHGQRTRRPHHPRRHQPPARRRPVPGTSRADAVRVGRACRPRGHACRACRSRRPPVPAGVRRARARRAGGRRRARHARRADKPGPPGDRPPPVRERPRDPALLRDRGRGRAGPDGPARDAERPAHRGGPGQGQRQRPADQGVRAGAARAPGRQRLLRRRRRAASCWCTTGSTSASRWRRKAG